MNELVLVANPGDDTIATFRLDDDKMAPLATSHVPSCGTFAIDEQRDLVFAASKDGPSVRTLRLDRTTGELTEIHRRPVEAPLAYVALSFDATRLLLASYRGGFGTAHLVHDDGTVGDPVGRIDHPNIHAVATSPDDAYAYFCSLGADLIAQCALGSDGSLTPLDPPMVPAPPGSGPRHIVLTREGTDAYVVTEFSGEVLNFRRDPATVRSPSSTGDRSSTPAPASPAVPTAATRVPSTSSGEPTSTSPKARSGPANAPLRPSPPSPPDPPSATSSPSPQTKSSPAASPSPRTGAGSSRPANAPAPSRCTT